MGEISVTAEMDMNRCIIYTEKFILIMLLIYIRNKYLKYTSNVTAIPYISHTKIHCQNRYILR